jgi:hypothetical protein
MRGKPSKDIINKRRQPDSITDTDLGLSGMKRMPMPRISAHRMPTPTTMRHEAELERFRVPIEIQSVQEINN